ncbi:hypothetical protein CMO85_00110 [Candidatus Woesearchaeota archaeon]|nr:hypothetical protein [Candidatus Woesearchaeota archaeon]
MQRGALFLSFLLMAVVATPMLSHEASATDGRSSSATTLTYTGEAQTVQLVGEWDWGTPLNMTNNSGTWSVDVELNEGLYCYKFIVDGAYIHDPTNPERVYCDDIENSLLRVNDHTRPHYTASIAGDALHVVYHPGSSQAAPDGTPSALTGATWDAGSSTWTLDLTQLDDGKHSLLIEGVDVEGNLAYDLLVPFWRGPHASFVWQDALIYMIMTDRFVNGNASNDGLSTGAAQGADWQGGDFAGVTAMIESGYFADLGVNALWLTPFNTAANGTGKAADGVHDVAAFHGYWPTEARGIDPRLGTPEELEAMIDAAHDGGIRVMMDFVVNHVHEDHEYFQAHPDWFNSGCICGQQDCDWTERRLDCQFTSYMPDVNWKNRNASEQFIADALWWMETFDLDGARIDAVKHVENVAISNLVAQINHRFETVGTDVYLKGETAMGWSGHSLEANQAQYGAINAYMGPGGLDGQADFVLYHAVVDNVFVSGNENYQHLDYWTNRSQDQYTPGSLMVPYVGSHDVSRLTSRADTGTGDAYNQWAEDGLPGQPGDVSAYHAALQAYGWLLTTPGAPLLYYGDEYGEYGGADPDNRHMYRDNTMWSDHEAALFANISALGQLRMESIALRQGDYSTRLAMPNLLVYNMTHDDQVMSVVLNRGGPTQVDGFTASDVVRFGDAVLASGQLSVGAHSVSVVELNVESETPPANNTNQTTAVLGCTDPLAQNYNPSATEDDNSCTYPPAPVQGCTNTTANNYNAEATQDDGTCTFDEPQDNASTDSNEGGTNTTSPGQTEGNSTTSPSNETSDHSGNETTNESVEQTDMQTCDLCCGETYQHPADQPCPSMMCLPCEDEETTTSSSSAEGVRNALIGVVILLVLVLALTGRRPPKHDVFDAAPEGEPDQANVS